MSGSGERERETIRPQFDRSIVMDFQGAKITSDTGFLLAERGRRAFRHTGSNRE